MADNSGKNGFFLVRLLLFFVCVDILLLFLYLSYIYSSLFIIFVVAAAFALYLLLDPRKLFLVYPVLVFAAKLLRLDYDKFRQAVIEHNNTRVLKNIKGKIQGRVLLLLPHCLQNSDCLYKVTWDKLENCHRCGKC
ncbi:MAG: DUF116 domain-containing protein, partial [Pseudomonadota bacterium]